jgi:hypothetical protein
MEINRAVALCRLAFIGTVADMNILEDGMNTNTPKFMMRSLILSKSFAPVIPAWVMTKLRPAVHSFG